MKQKAVYLKMPDGELMFIGANSLYRAIKKGFQLQRLIKQKLKVRVLN
jgi:hypothetical protein